MKETPPEEFRIAELAQRTGLTPRTIRYYVAEDLLPPPTGAGPYRMYGPDHLLCLEAIKRFKEQYLPLTEIRSRLAGASRSELEAVVNGTADESERSALDYLATIRPSGPPIFPSPGLAASASTGFVASLGGAGMPVQSPRRGSAEIVHSSSQPRSGLSEDVLNSRQEDLGQTVWNRVILAPGVELNYQLTGDRARDTAVLRLIRNARHILGTVS